MAGKAQATKYYWTNTFDVKDVHPFFISPPIHASTTDCTYVLQDAGIAGMLWVFDETSSGYIKASATKSVKDRQAQATDAKRECGKVGMFRTWTKTE